MSLLAAIGASCAYEGVNKAVTVGSLYIPINDIFIIGISEAVNEYSGQVVRLALLSAHYSQPLDWNDELLNNQKNTIDKWYSLYKEQKDEGIEDIADVLLDDLNTPGFIAKIHELYTKASAGDKKKKSLFKKETDSF